MKLDLEKVLLDCRQATTDDLLDRVTAFREGIEPEALTIIEEELHRRGIGRNAIASHEEKHRQTALWLPDGTAERCSFCRRPAVAAGWSWHRLWGIVPIFPRRFCYCADHQP